MMNNMTRKEIESILMKNDSTLLSFPERGPWGDNKYRGNCSGWIHAFLIWKYQVNKMAELFAGGGTGYDVCKDMNITYVGADLNPNPVRPGIIQTNAIEDDVPEAFLGSDMIFMHPPYGAEIHIPYAGHMYADPTNTLSKSDLGQMPWSQFIKELNTIIMKYYAAMDTGARMSILMGDVRRNGLHSMLTDIVKPGTLEQIIIKEQHNCESNKTYYANKNFVPLAHEYILILKKISPYIINFQMSKEYRIDIRDSSTATWRDVINSVICKIGKETSFSLEEVYSEIEGHKKCETNPHWKEKIRQILQQDKHYVNIKRGIWAMVA